jgi:hypothetical protein
LPLNIAVEMSAAQRCILPTTVTDAVSLAFEHTKRQLFQPFRFWQWTRLAAVGLLAGEMSSGGCNFSHNLQRSASRIPNIDPAILGAVIAVALVSGLVVAIVVMYISSVMRFILFDSVLTKECRIRAGWMRRQIPGLKYFLWQIGFAIAVLVVMAILIGIPVAIAFSLGWIQHYSEHTLALILGGIVIFFVVLAFAVAAAVIQVLTKDFVVPQMALEGIGAVEAWRRLWPMIEAELGGYAAYIGMKILLAIMAGVAMFIVSLIIGLMVAIPTLGLAIIAIFTGKSAGLTWNAYTITVSVAVGLILLAAFLYLMALIAVPVIVFFPAYSIYFFAGRYRALNQILYPAPAAPLPAGLPPNQPPPWTPAPIG